MKPTLTVAISFSLFVLGCLAADKEKHPRLPATAMELIEELKRTKRIYATWESRLNYVKESELPGLIKLIDSKEPCAYSVMSVSSHLPQGRSTVGNEAAYLIQSFLMRFYPSKLSSDRNPPSKAELKHWYRQWTHLQKLEEQGGAGQPAAAEESNSDSRK